MTVLTYLVTAAVVALAVAVYLRTSSTNTLRDCVTCDVFNA